MRVSVIVPTYERRDLAVANVAALDRQELAPSEVIVVVDGSTDGTAEALRTLRTSFALVVLEQANHGAGEARNTGAAAATGELLVFLDDDMEAHPGMLAAHVRSQHAGADLVLGDLPIHPRSPRTLLTAGVAGWARSRRDRLTAPGAEVGLPDLLTGQMSISRAAFDALGRFDAELTRGGLFGGEDIDLGYRVVKAGLRVVFDPEAISYQYYDVDPGTYLRRSFEAGRAEVELVVKHPERADGLGHGPRFLRRRSRMPLEPFVGLPGAFSAPLRAGVAALVRTGGRRPGLTELFFAVRTLEHRRGMRAARRQVSRGELRVLAYHAIADLSDDPILGEYGVPASRFRAQLDGLIAHGWSFVDLEAVLEALDGGQPLPPRALLLTFDDAYADLLTAACPVLVERDIPALVFAVAGQTGGSNAWDRPLGARELTLLDADGLRTVAARGVEVGAHGWSHRPLPDVHPEELAREVVDPLGHVEGLGLRRPRAFSYPHGETTTATTAAVRDAGYEVAFTVAPGVVRRGDDRWRLARVEVLGSDTPRGLRIKLRTATWPAPARCWAGRLAGPSWSR